MHGTFFSSMPVRRFESGKNGERWSKFAPKNGADIDFNFGREKQRVQLDLKLLVFSATLKTTPPPKPFCPLAAGSKFAPKNGADIDFNFGREKQRVQLS